jgi:hypothetical protein
LKYSPYPPVPEALDEALRRIPDGTVGILPKGGICLPVLRSR